MYRNTSYVGKIQLNQIENGEMINRLITKYKNEYETIRFKNVPITEEDFDIDLRNLLDKFKLVVDGESSAAMIPEMEKEITNLKDTIRDLSFDIQNKIDGCHLDLYRRKDVLMSWDDLDYNVKTKIETKLEDSDKILQEFRTTTAEIKRQIGIDDTDRKPVDPALEIFTRRYNNKPKETHSHRDVSVVDYLNFLFSTVDFKTEEDMQVYGGDNQGLLDGAPSNLEVLDLGEIRSLYTEYYEDFGHIIRNREHIININEFE